MPIEECLEIEILPITIEIRQELTGSDRVPANRAGEKIGLVTEVVDQGQHRVRAMEKARQIVAVALLSIELTKRAIIPQLRTRGMREALLAAVETDIIIEASEGDERAEFRRDARMRSPGEMLAIEPSSASKGVWLYVPFNSEVE